jgi:hypothetical protein
VFGAAEMGATLSSNIFLPKKITYTEEDLDGLEWIESENQDHLPKEARRKVPIIFTEVVKSYQGIFLKGSSGKVLEIRIKQLTSLFYTAEETGMILLQRDLGAGFYRMRFMYISKMI